MTDPKVLKKIKEKAQKWLDPKYDDETRELVKELLEDEDKQDELVDAFYKDLEFGTGGLRGKMGPGTNRMNKYTTAMATQGLCNYLKECFNNLETIKVAIAHDNRNNSRSFAETAAGVLSANGIKVILFDDLRPTPELSYAIRQFNCQSGIVITASHNPKEYNGFKAYWEDGGQVVPPHDKNIIREAQKIKSIEEVKFNGSGKNITLIGEDFDKQYMDMIKGLSLSPDVIEKHRDIKIVYTPIHGTGVKLIPMTLKHLGFNQTYNVPRQDVPDGNFPTVHSPNPEESAALNLALEKANKVGADLVMGTDPDGDRVGIAIRDHHEKLRLLNGNQTAALLTYYLLKRHADLGKLTGKEYICKTIVTSELLTEIADHFKVKHYHVLTGFKYIAEIIKNREGKEKFIGGGEESYGYMIGEETRDKDAVASCAMIAEIAAWARDQGKSLFELLLDIYTEHHFYLERLISVYREGQAGEKEISEMMQNFRSGPPEKLAGSPVTWVMDYQSSKALHLPEGKEEEIELPKSNVLQFITEAGTKVSMRPSGTEPKIKFYFSVKDKLPSRETFGKVEDKLNERIGRIIQELGIEQE